MPTYRFNLIPKAESWSSFVANWRNHPDSLIRSKLHIVAIEAAKTHGMVFGLGHNDEDALKHLRLVRDEVQDDGPLLEDINEIRSGQQGHLEKLARGRHLWALGLSHLSGGGAWRKQHQ